MSRSSSDETSIAPPLGKQIPITDLNERWDREGDSITFYWEPEEDDCCYTEWLGHVTLYRCFKTDKVCGVKVHGISKVINRLVTEEISKAVEEWLVGIFGSTTIES